MTDYEKITDFKNLYDSYKKAKAGGKHKDALARFSVMSLEGTQRLKQSLEDKTYEVSGYTEFEVYEPKKRLIMSGTFKDKVVQHCLCDYVLLPNMENKFIDNNFAGRIGKGTLYGLDRLKADMLQFHKKHGLNGYILKCDIAKFFYNIEHEKLKEVVEFHMQDSDIQWLCNKIIDSTQGKGLPLGNQSSQVFALMLLDGLDHYIIGELGIKFYGRYMDDFYLIHWSKEYLKECLSGITEFVSSLGLSLNGKTQIIPFKNGIDFCGFHTYITADGKAIRKLKNSNKRNAKKKFRKMAYLVKGDKLSKEKFKESYTAWKNHASHGNCIKLIYSMDRMVQEILEE